MELHVQIKFIEIGVYDINIIILVKLPICLQCFYRDYQCFLFIFQWFFHVNTNDFPMISNGFQRFSNGFQRVSITLHYQSNVVPMFREEL